MRIEELEDFLVKNQDDLEWRMAEKGEKIGSVEIDNDNTILIWSSAWETITPIDLNKLQKISVELLKAVIPHGKNVTQMTRVTGFFSNIGNWNKGKIAELRDRYRITENGWR